MILICFWHFMFQSQLQLYLKFIAVSVAHFVVVANGWCNISVILCWFFYGKFLVISNTFGWFITLVAYSLLVIVADVIWIHLRWFWLHNSSADSMYWFGNVLSHVIWSPIEWKLFEIIVSLWCAVFFCCSLYVCSVDHHVK